MTERSVVVLSGARTAIGSYGGSLKDIPPTQLGAIAIREAVKRAAIDPAQVGHVVFGNVIHSEPKDMYFARVAALEGGLPIQAGALTVNRLCGSGLQAIVSAAQNIMLGDADIAVAGGAESMSRALYGDPTQRWGARMGPAESWDMMIGALTDPFSTVHMGITAENVAEQFGITRDDQDALALESQRRAAHAISSGFFKEQIVPVELKTRKGTTVFDTDEHVRGETTTEGLAKLRAAFKEGGSVTAGNASGLNDAGASIVMMEAEAAQRAGHKPIARLVSYGHAGVEPRVMGLGPIPAVRRALERAGLGVDDIDVVESNEAFAAQACAVMRELGFDPAKVNPNGGAIALGHPIGATGCILTIKAIAELHRTGGRYAVVTMCIGGGQGIAGIFERM